MACRRGRPRSRADQSEGHTPSNMDQLTFKYMEMCKVETSSDSDSEISPRWSDTSILGSVSRAPGRGPSRRAFPLTYKSTGRQACYSLLLDPYDGSSEDSDKSNIDVSSRQTRHQSKGGGGCRLPSQRRRFISHHPASVALRERLKNGMKDLLMDQQPTVSKDSSDVQPKCESDSELWDCELDTLSSNSGKDGYGIITEEMVTDSTTHVQNLLELNDSGWHSRRSSTPHTPGFQTSVETSSSQMVDSCSERSPCSCNRRSLWKRKGCFPGIEGVELRSRKRQCVANMEVEEKETD
ncbi:uncharacterized protein ACNS7B_000828 [Menidia menidia]